MSNFESGDRVVLKSGGPIMTVDTVNTDIFDDSKITGLLCAWFVGNRLERVRFDHRAVERVPEGEVPPNEARQGLAGDYVEALDEMVTAMNTPVEETGSAPEANTKTDTKAAPKRRPAVKVGTVAGSPISH